MAMEPNAVPGLTNRSMAQVDRTCARELFERPRSYFPPGRAEVTGVPVRRSSSKSGRASGTADLRCW